MTRFFIFTGKEIKEQLKNYKALILTALLLMFGMSSPLLAKAMPELLSQFDLGFTITLPEATFLDAYAQFFKNATQICTIAVVLIFSGNITQEMQKGTHLLLFSKGLSRGSFLMSKFFTMSLYWTVGYALSAAVCWGYTAFLFPQQSPQNLLLAFFCLWLLVELLLSVILLGSTLFSQTSAVLLSVGGFVVILFLLQIFPDLASKLPLFLGSCNLDLISGTIEISALWPSFGITSALILLFLLAAIAIFRKKEL